MSSLKTAETENTVPPEVEQKGAPPEVEDEAALSDGAASAALIDKLLAKGLSTEGTAEDCINRLLAATKAERGADKGKTEASEESQVLSVEDGGPTLNLIAKLEAKGLSTAGTRQQAMARLMSAQKAEEAAAAAPSIRGGFSSSSSEHSLKIKLRARGLPTVGNKQELLTRLSQPNPNPNPNSLPYPNLTP